VPEDKSMDLGPWSDDDLKETVYTASAAGVDSDLPPDARFISGVAKLIRRRIAQAGKKADPVRPALFLLKPKVQIQGLDIAPKRVPMLDNGLTPVTGRLWFVSPVVVAGSYVELKDCDDDELFSIVTDELQLGDVPTVIFDPRSQTREVRFYRNGLNCPEDYEPSSVSYTNLSLPRVLETIDRIYKQCLITPGAQGQAGRLWKKNSKFLPIENTERVVQFYLRIGLTTAFPYCTIRPEQHDVPGRLDLEIEESNPIDRSCFTRHAILELKVLRSYWSTGTIVSEGYTLNCVESGVKQAASYRDERDARAAALCCFDMRRKNTGEACFEHVVGLAKEHQVELRLWFIYATSKQYRDAIISSTEP
jgi:hypothetical protein